MASKAKESVWLKSSDGEVFEVDQDVAFELQIIKDMCLNIDFIIPLPRVSSKILAKVIEYNKYHMKIQKRSVDKPITPIDEIIAWDKTFLNVDQQTLYDLLMV